jgi:tRNA-dihydrouridine synthase A
MIGRAAYHNPWLLADAGKTRAQVVHAMKKYCDSQRVASLRGVARHMLGLYHATPRAKLWRRMLSDSAALARNDSALLLETLAAVEGKGSIMLAA